jgi:succinate dehydrogenase / fumarate reductase flavoprotein subunit
MYSPEMAESIKKVEATRQFRLKQTIPRLAATEKSEILKKFHPDYKEGSTRALAVGPSKGSKVPHEFADIFESYSLITPENFNISKIGFDVAVLIIGGGGAGAAAALSAQENGARVLLATKLRLGDANTIMAQGGIQAADKANDSPSIHYLDVIGGGGFYNVPELARVLVMDAPGIIKWLENLGVMLDKESNGSLIGIHGGGTSRRRMHSARDYSGGEIMKVLRDEVTNRNIEVIEFSPVIELLTDGRTCTGAVLYNIETEEILIVRAKSVILATGGSGRLHVQNFPTTNHYGATADGLVIAYRAGCKLLYMDTIQYHPTGAAYPEQILGQLVTEKVRGLGAHLCNREGNRYIYELETRDVESAAIIRECLERNLGVVTPSGQHGVWLDSPVIDIIHGAGTTVKQLPAMYRQYMRFQIDITKEPILIYPTQHYQNGGVVINEFGETDVENLYAAGEVSGGVHGRNRLMGNSLLDILVFGRRAGAAAARKSKTVTSGRLTVEHIKNYHRELQEAGVGRVRFSPVILPDYRRKEQRKSSAPVT